MSQKSKWEYLVAVYYRYRQASRVVRQQILDEFCSICSYNRKYAIRLLNGAPPHKSKPKRRTRARLYGSQLISILAAVWEAAGYPCSIRLTALLPLWLPWVKKHFDLSITLEHQLLAISPATIDRRLKDKRHSLKRRIYGRTKPGTLLKHHIPIRADHWNVTIPGFTETDLVSHSGNRADGEFIHSLNQTDIHTTWVETRAVMGKGQTGVTSAMDEIRLSLPFKLKGVDSDNDSSFINYHLDAFCHQHDIQFTRSRPYKKDDNAHVEQKNWTHVRKLMGYVRYDSQEALDAMNDLYRGELRLFQNLFQPSMKLVKKIRVGSRTKRIYGLPKTPFQRTCESDQADLKKVAQLKKLFNSLDPFELSKTIDRKLEHIYQLANHRQNPLTTSTPKTSTQTKQPEPLTRVEQETIKTISEVFGIPINVKNSHRPKNHRHRVTS